MTNTMIFNFDDLPLVIAGPVDAALINGCAEIEYYPNGDWDIVDVSLEGFGERDANGKRQWPMIPAPEPFYSMISDRLHNRKWCARISDAVREQLASDREDALEQRAEMRRDARMGL